MRRATGRMGVLLAIAWRAAGADEAMPVYTLEECVRVGLEQSAAAANARRDQAIAAAQAKQARAEALPQLSLNGRYLRQDEVPTVEMQGSTFELGVLDNYGAQAQVSQLLYSGGRVSAALKAARLNRSYADWALQEKQSQIERDIRLAFNKVLLARSAAGVRRESVAQLEALLDRTQQKNLRGAASDFDLLSARVRLSNERPELIRAENDRALALEALRHLVTSGAVPFDVRGDLVHEPVNPNLDALLAAGVERRPAVKSLREFAALKEQDVIAAGAQGLPSLKAQAAYDGANSYGFMSEGWEWHWSAGLTASWNVWDGGLTRGVVEQKKLELAKARTDLDDFRNTIRLQIRQAFLSLQHAARAVDSVRDTVGLAEKALTIARARYEAGLTTRLEYADAALALSTARLAACQALSSYEEAVTQLEYASGVKRADF